jgi:manganese/zinc/iron transport system permease protein
MGAEFVQLSLTPILIGLFAAIACALPGNFLILRRQALLGDAISHVVLPGIVVAFLLTGVVSAIPMMLGAGVAALVAVGLIEAVKRLGRIEPGAAMGVVFTAMFAGGVLLLEQSDASSVHLDVQHALMGNLESLIWFRAEGWGSLLDPVALADLPPELPRMAAVCAVIAALTLLFWRPLTISTFDEGFARALGLPTTAIALGLAATAAAAAVAAFDRELGPLRPVGGAA